MSEEQLKKVGTPSLSKAKSIFNNTLKGKSTIDGIKKSTIDGIKGAAYLEKEILRKEGELEQIKVEEEIDVIPTVEELKKAGYREIIGDDKNEDTRAI